MAAVYYAVPINKPRKTFGRWFQEEMMPDEIYKALNRLDLQRWNPREIKESQEGIMHRDLFETTLAIEREEGEKLVR